MREIELFTVLSAITDFCQCKKNPRTYLDSILLSGSVTYFISEKLISIDSRPIWQGAIFSIFFVTTLCPVVLSGLWCSYFNLMYLNNCLGCTFVREDIVGCILRLYTVIALCPCSVYC